MTATCIFEGNSDMYGLGIRIGYYLQWYGLILAAWWAPSEVSALRITNAFFVAATFLALLIQVAKGSLEAAEIYVTLLFTFGSSFYLLPIHMWRTATCCDELWDPSRFPKAKPASAMFDFLNTVLLLAVYSFQIWFWVSQAPTLKTRTCVEYGFLFESVRLNSRAFRLINLVLCSLQLSFLTMFTLFRLFKEKVSKFVRHREGEGRNKALRVQIFKIFDSAIKCTIATTIITATELTIRWNEINGVHSINSAGQMIPFLLGLGVVLRIFYLRLRGSPNEDQEESDLRPIEWDELPVMSASFTGQYPTQQPLYSFGETRSIISS